MATCAKSSPAASTWHATRRCASGSSRRPTDLNATQENQAVVRRFYDELWNHWRLDVAEEIVAADVRFRGSLGTVCESREELIEYVEAVRHAFPDWHNRVDEILAIDDRVVTRMTWSGTHRGPLGSIDATGARVEYEGAAFFRLAEGSIVEAWVVGDTQALYRALGGA